jgi:hypothetical protein
MIVVRDIFRLKFGQAKEATDLWKKAAAMLQQSGYGVKSTRLLTDLAGGSYYTIVLESAFDSLAEWEKAHQQAKLNAAWREVYAKILPLTEEGRREVLSIIA